MDTIHSKHKHITNPTLTHTNKIIWALSHCAQVRKGKDTTATDQQLRDLQRLVEVTQANLLQQASGNSPALLREQTQMQPPTTEQLTQQTQAALRVQPNALPRVQPNEQNTKCRTTQSTAMQQPSTTDVHPPRITRRRGRWNNTLTLPETKKDSDHLQLRTRSQSAQEAQRASPPALNTCSKLAANAVTQRFKRMENKVQQALAVMKKDTGRLLNYQKLINLQPKIQESVESVGSKQIWSLSTGCWQLHQRNKHDQIYPQARSTKEQIEGHNIQSVCLHQMT